MDNSPADAKEITGTIELDDAFVDDRREVRRGRGAEGKTAILVTCEHNNGKPGVVAIKAAPNVNKENVKTFAQESIEPGQTLNTDALRALNILTEEYHHIAKATPAEALDEWLHGISGQYMQEYLNEFCYLLNRRCWE